MGSVHYVCLCNRLTEAMIDDAVAKGARTQTEVLKRLRLKHGCSICTVEVGKAIDTALAGHRLAAQ